MLSGRYPSDEFAELRPRLTWDRLRGTVRAREGAQRLAVANAGTIPDRGLYGVFLADGTEERRGRPRWASSTRRWSSRAAPARSSCSAPRAGASPRSRATACSSCPRPASRARCRSGRPTAGRARWSWAAPSARSPASCSRPAAGRGDAARSWREHDARRRWPRRTSLAYLDEQREATGALPDDRTLVLERTRDEMGDWRLCLLSPWGGRVHAPWALALEAKLRARGEAEVETIWSDDGIVVRLPDRERPPEARGPPARTPRRSRTSWWASSGGRRSSPPTSARRPAARSSCRAAARASARRSGCSASVRPTC